MSLKTVLLSSETLKSCIDGAIVGDEIKSRIVSMVSSSVALSTVLTKFVKQEPEDS